MVYLGLQSQPFPNETIFLSFGPHPSRLLIGASPLGTPTFYQSLQLFSSSTPRSLPRPVTSTHFRSLRQSERSRKQGPQSTWSHLRESSEQVHLWTQRAEWQTLWGGGWRIGSNCPSGLRFLLRRRESLKLDRGGACTKGHYASQAKMVNFMICESHPHLHFVFFLLIYYGDGLHIGIWLKQCCVGKRNIQFFLTMSCATMHNLLLKSICLSICSTISVHYFSL